MHVVRPKAVDRSVVRSSSFCEKFLGFACLVSPSGSYLVMAAQLSPVQKDGIWRVKIVWPNRAVHYFGKFTSERDAIDWINAHPRLTGPVAENELDRSR
jgi:hypothetical protein